MASESRRADVNAMFTLKVDNISYETTMEELREHFGRHGEVGDVYIPKDRATNRVRGYGFVRFVEKDCADKALEEDGKEFHGRTLRVQHALKPRPQGTRDDRGIADDNSRREHHSRRHSKSKSRSRSRSRSRKHRHHNH